MAKQWNGYLGGFSGRLGPAVGYSWNGVWCLRSRPVAVRNPRTPRQMEHREMFREEVRLAACMRQAVVAGLTVMARQMQMTSYNLFVHLNQQCFSLIDGVFTVDYSRLAVSEGPVAPVAFGEAAVEEGNVLTVSFERNPLRMRADNYDGVRLYAYSPELGRGYLSAPVYRRDKRLSVSLPDELAGRELHLYGFVQDGEGRCSASTYVGSVTMAVADEFFSGSHTIFGISPLLNDYGQQQQAVADGQPDTDTRGNGAGSADRDDVLRTPGGAVG